MIAIPLIYFVGLAIFLYCRSHRWGLDLAAVSLLIVISLCAIMIDVTEIYGSYGINKPSYNILTLLLFCIQWTIVIYPLHALSKLELQPLPDCKNLMLYVWIVSVIISAGLMIFKSMDDIRDALIMDMADVRAQHYKELYTGGDKSSNYLYFVPSILVQNPMPTIALLLWFYMNSFVNGNYVLKVGIIVASIVQAVLAIVTAGRAAMIYWIFDFYLLYSFFYRFVATKVKYAINISALVFGIAFAALFVTITVSRFDGSESDRDPLESLYGYAGQHVNNFSCMIMEGGNSPFSIDRELPFLSRFVFGLQFDLEDHYRSVSTKVKAMVNVFDTYGAEVYLDWGWIGYVLFHVFLIAIGVYINRMWKELSFYRLLLAGIAITFFTHGLFAWPFTHHYTSMSLALLFLFVYLFRYKIKV